MGQGLNGELGKDSLLEDTKHKLDRSLQLLRSNDPSTEALDLSNCGLGLKGVEVGASALDANTSLKALDLSYNQIGAAGIPSLVEGLANNTSLIALNLSGNEIGNEGLSHLAAYLKENPPLEELVLFHNGITDDGVLQLVNALQFNDHLLKVNLSMNKCTQRSMTMFRQLLKTNESLHHLALNENNIRFDADPKRYAALEVEIQEALAANEERVTKQKHHKDVLHQKRIRREQKEEEERALQAAADEAERARIAEEIRQREEQERKEAAEVQQLEHEMQQRKRQLDERRARNDPQVKQAQAQAWCDRAVEQAYAWRDKLTMNGQFVKEWRNGFTVMTTKPGDRPGANPSLTCEFPRRLKACWCEPDDATAPYAKTLHYHCKYEAEVPLSGTASSTKGGGSADPDAPPKYSGCRCTGHTCASIGFYAKPLPNLTAQNFFASQHVSNAPGVEQN